jgi:hypothetical protein
MRWRNTIGSSSSMSAAEPEQSATACSTDSIGMTTLTHPSASGGPAVAATASPTVDKRCEQPGQRRSLSAACRLSLTLPRLTVVAFRLRLPLAAGRSRPAAAKRPENTRAAAAGVLGYSRPSTDPQAKMATTRRLAAILAADVAGYSRLMGTDEDVGGSVVRAKSAACGGLKSFSGGLPWIA